MTAQKLSDERKEICVTKPIYHDGLSMRQIRLFLSATGVCLFLLVLWRLVRCLSRLVRSTRSLCDAGAETNQAMTDGRTPLFIASQKGHLEVVRCLCDAGSAPLHYI